MNMRNFFHGFILLAILTCQAVLVEPVYASGTVGDGTPESCTEEAFDAALIGGGPITFNCGGAATIILTSPKVIANNTQINGSGLISLS